MPVQIVLNGQPRHLAEPTSLTALLDELELSSRHVAVEVNCELVPRGEHPSRVLTDGDQVEIVTLVGGG